MGDFDGRLCHFGRRVQQLRAVAGRQPGDSGGCVRARMSASPGAIALCDHLVAGKVVAASGSAGLAGYRDGSMAKMKLVPEWCRYIVALMIEIAFCSELCS